MERSKMPGSRHQDNTAGQLVEYLVTQCARVQAESLLLLARPLFKGQGMLDTIAQASPKTHLQYLPLPVDFTHLQSHYSICAVLIDLTDFQKGVFLQDLARLKNQYCNYIECIVFDQDSNTENALDVETTLFSLGFRHSGCVIANKSKAHCFRYEIKSYNKKRSWNSPENWANPKNFNRYRW